MPEPAFESATVDRLRVPPHSIQAEQQILGALLLDASQWDAVADRVAAADFWRREHQLVFQAVADLVAEQQAVDPVTVAERLQAAGTLTQAGGLACVGSLATDALPTSNVRAYADIVREHSVVRQLLRAATGIADRCYRPEGRRAPELVAEAEQAILGIGQARAHDGSGFVPIKAVLTRTINGIEDRFERDSPLIGVPSGFADLDERTCGFQPGDLIIVAGRPSMGKTAFAMNVAEHAAVRGNLPVAVFSLEMPAEQLNLRMLASLGRIDFQKLRTGQLEDADWSRLTSATSLLSQARLFIDDEGALTPADIASRCRRLTREVGHLGLVVVDYLQLMRSPDDRENRNVEVAAISRALKALAKELSVPIIALSQLNRGLENRAEKRPNLADLRDSGAIEQDADLVLFVYRDEVHNPQSDDKGVAEIIIGKQRNGPIGTVRLTFLGEYTRFESFALPSSH